MVSFDPDVFMQQTIDSPLETEFRMVPEGEYTMTIDDFDSSAIEEIKFDYKKGPRAGTPGSMTKFTCPFVVQDDKVKQELNRQKVVVSKQLILDIGDDGGLDFGTNKNVDLGRIRAAVGQNDPGSPWSIAQLRGAGPFIGKVEHVSWEYQGKKGKRAEVTRVVRIV